MNSRLQMLMAAYASLGLGNGRNKAKTEIRSFTASDEHDKMTHKGLKCFDVGGVEVYALNKKSARKKAIKKFGEYLECINVDEVTEA